jgi:diadenylate cyclase
MPFEQFGFLIPSPRDVVEILVVAYVIYRALLFLAGTRALQILIGAFLLGVVYIGAQVLKLNMIATLLGVVFTYGGFAAIVVLQPELRHALARLGRSRALNFFSSPIRNLVADEIAGAVDRLSRSGTGAIVAVEGDVALDDYIETGTGMHATVSGELLSTIFTPYSPLHDGAVVIRADQIVGAGCVLPLTQFPVTDKSLGTRHRAALGLSEESDAIVIVVSEETSRISIAVGGLLHQGVTPQQVRGALANRGHPSLALQASPSEASAS